MVKCVEVLEDGETLVIRNGEPDPLLKTNLDVPRALVLNSMVPQPSGGPGSSDTDRGTPKRPARMAADWMFTGPASALPETDQTCRAAAQIHFDGSLAGRLVVAGDMG